MKRALSVVVFVVVATAAFGSDATHRYVVALKPAAGARSVQAVDFAARGARELTYLDAVIADLTTAEVAQLKHDPAVRYVVDGEIQYHAFDDDGTTTAAKAATESHPTDAQVTPYGITMVHAPDVWPVTRGDGINVAIVDTGIDRTHPELKGIYSGGETFVPNTADNTDDEGHGTHVAGIIAAADNNVGVVGVAPNVKLWAVKVLDSSGSGSLADIASGLNWVLGKKTELGGNWIVNMSLGGPSGNAGLSDACARLANAGVLVFAASGNKSPDNTTSIPDPVAFPAAYPSVVAVGAVDSNQAIASFSNQGPQVAISGPGVAVLSTFPVGKGTNTFVAKSAAFYNADAVVGSKRDQVSGKFIYCGIGATAGDFPLSVRGNIALIERGQATFNTKAKNAVNAGASAIVIYNCSKTASPSTCGNDDFTAGWTMIGKVNATTGLKDPKCDDGTSTNCKDDPADLAFNWPVTVRVTNADGVVVKADSSATITAANLVDDYATESGTSMACPHVVGVAALVWGAAPTATASDVKLAILTTAHDLGAAGQDSAYGFGLIDALQAAKAIAPSKFGSPVTPPATDVPGRRIIRRGH